MQRPEFRVKLSVISELFKLLTIRQPVGLLLLISFLLTTCGCLFHNKQINSPTAAGLESNSLRDPNTLNEPVEDMYRSLIKKQTAYYEHANYNVLCLSGGGSYGAYTVGVLTGWTQRGDRPCFDVVTGISTGALIAPFAFLGSAFDPTILSLYTNVETRDIYRIKGPCGILSESFATNKPLRKMMDQMVHPELVQAVAREHQKGRRLYIGTTEAEGKRFVVWDMGAIASQGRPQDIELMKEILLASSAIPGVFPAARIPVYVNGQCFHEMHVDGTVSQSVFFRPPVQAIQHPKPTNVYVIVAGKLYADSASVSPSAINIAIENLQSFSYAHTRGDLVRIWSMCSMAGYGFKLAAIPQDCPAPKSMTEFKPEEMQNLVQSAVRQMLSGTAWRSTPPGNEPGEEPLLRTTNELIHLPR
ncbi:MAG: patatin-like phospholipase family protein [Planctomycetia bacterium]|nr:patatin-like phospholipase family protein [Planctomycetia bacterium]